MGNKENDLDKKLRSFEKKHPIKTPKNKKAMSGFVSDIERQLDRLEKRRKK
jgi:hypothetical protein